MKTALELLGDERCEREECGNAWKDILCAHEVELVARRAREEMRDLCADAVDSIPCSLGGDIDITETAAMLRALPVAPEPK